MVVADDVTRMKARVDLAYACAVQVHRAGRNGVRAANAWLEDDELLVTMCNPEASHGMYL